MRTSTLSRLGWAVALLAGAAACSSGERSSSSSSPATGDDPVSIELSQPVVGPVGELEIVIATVEDSAGRPVDGARIEWMLPQGSVGAIVDIDRDGSSSAHELFAANYAMTGTNGRDHTLDMGTSDTADDIELGPGQSWIAISSPMEGVTHVMAYASQIRDWDDQRATAAKQWRDVHIDFPAGGTKRVGESGDLTVRVTQSSDGVALAGQEVTFSITGGPDATLSPSGGQTYAAKTNENGVVTTKLVPRGREAGAVTVQIDVVRPENKECCEPAVLLGSAEVVCRYVAASIDIRKSAPAEAVINSDFQYSIVVTAGPGADARDVKVTDTLPDGIDYVSSVPSASVRGQTLSWDLGTMAPNARRNLSVTVQATKTGKFTNCADVAAEEGSLKDRDCADTVVTAPELALEKTGPTRVIACDEITYTYRVSNNGDAPATNVRIVDNLPSGLTTAAGGRSINLEAGTLAAGQTKTLSAKVQAADRGTYTNTATATADGGLSAKDTHELTATKPELEIVKDGPERRFVGRPISYDITVTNTGDAPARDLVVTDAIPSGTSFLSASDGGRNVGGVVTWNLGTLQPEASKKLSLTISPTRDGVVVNTARAEAYCAEEVSDSHSVTVEGIPAILLEVVDEDDPVEVGTTTVYAITVTNQGSADARNIVIQATLPAQLSFVGADGPTSESVVGKVVNFASLPRLAPGAEATYRITVRANAAGDVRTAFSMTSAQSSVPVEENESTFLYE